MASISGPSGQPPGNPPQQAGKRPKAPLTSLAKKYRHPYRIIAGLSHRVLKYTGKSGLTPLSPFQKAGRSSYIQRKLRLYAYQQRRYYAFSAAELRDMEALSALDTRPMRNNLQNPLHPVFAKSQWDNNRTMPKHMGFVPILGGLDSLWQVDNPLVWGLLQPGLQLASRLWDALFNGQYKLIDESRKPSGRKDELLLSFHQRDSTLWRDPEERRKLGDQLRDASKKIRFGLISGYNEAHTGLPKNPVQTYGGTIPAIDQEYSKISLSIEILQPLLRNDLTDAELISNHFRIATTVIHECGHAMWAIMNEEGEQPKLDKEPYFESELLNEVGWSLEDKLWGGEAIEIVAPNMSEGGPGLGPMGVMKTNWFTDRHKSYTTGQIELDHQPVPPGAIDPYYTYEYWPIPVLWQLSLFKPSLWEYFVRNMGSGATKMGPLTYGTRTLNKERYDVSKYTALTGFGAVGYFDEIVIDNSMTDQEKYEKSFEISRRNHARELIKRRNVYLSGNTNVDEDLYQQIAGDDDRSDTEDEESDSQPAPPTIDQQRYLQISQYLFENRLPLELALDTMDFDMPEATLYRYIQNRGGLGLTINPQEWRNFLLYTDSQNLLFRFQIQNMTGIVNRIDNGWPSSDRTFSVPAVPYPSAQDMQNFEEMLGCENFLVVMYERYKDFRDVDINTLRGTFNKIVPEDERVDQAVFHNIVYQFADTSNPNQDITLGPEGVVRLRCVIPQHIKDEVDASRNPPSSASSSSTSSPKSTKSARPASPTSPTSPANMPGSSKSAPRKNTPEKPEEPKLQEEIDLENFEKELREGAEGALAEVLRDVDLYSDSEDGGVTL